MVQVDRVLGDPRISRRFWNRITVDPVTGCWTCSGRSTPEGYRQAGNTTAHRFIYQRLVGPVTRELQVDHRCHDPGARRRCRACRRDYYRNRYRRVRESAGS